MLGTRWGRMAEALEGTLDVSWNGNIDSVVDIIPINGEVAHCIEFRSSLH
jgi:hypothetical protein